MTKIAVLALAATLASTLHSGRALAQLTSKVWVSNAGADTFQCGAVTSPCATFGIASAFVAAGGEIGVLTPGDYGVVVLDKSIKITNDGTGEASIQVPGALPSGIGISAGVGDVISLRGLVIDGRGGLGVAGLIFNSGSALHIQNCVIRDMEGLAAPGFAAGWGILFTPGGNSQLFVSDTIIFNNGSTAGTGGIVIQPPGTGSAAVVLDRTHLENNVVGLLVDGSASTGNGVHLVLRDSVVSGNASDGVRALTASGHAPAFLVVEHSSTVNNAGAGILANGPHATIILNDDTITRNATGMSAVNGGQIISFGNNKNFNNLGPEGAPTGLFSQM